MMLPHSDTAKKQSLGLQASTSYAPLILLVLAQIGTTADNAAMNIAVAELTVNLGATLGDIQIATTVYALIAGAFMIVGGMLGIIIGWRRNLRIGIILGIAGELCAALSPTMTLFTWAGRVLFALGASLITPSILGLIPALWSGRRRAVAFGAVAGAAAISTLSPLLLGVLIDSGGFRITFGFLACYFVLVLACTALIPKLPRTSQRPRVDYVGMVIAVSGLMLFLLGISRLSSWGVIEPRAACPFTVFGISPALPLILAGVALLAVLMPVEGRIEDRYGSALIPRVFLKTPPVRAGLLAVATPFFYMGAQGIIMTPYLQLVAGFSATQTGFLSLLSGLPMFALAVSLPKIAPHLSSRLIIRAGLCAVIVACLLMAGGIEPGGIGFPLFVGVFIGGCGVGAVNSQANNAVASAVSSRDAQQSGGMQGAARNVGLALGTALAGTVFLMVLAQGMTAGIPENTVDDLARHEILEEGSSLMSDEAFNSMLDTYNLDAPATTAFYQAKIASQTNATRATFILIAVLAAAALPGTRRLTETSAPSKPEPASSRTSLSAQQRD